MVKLLTLNKNKALEYEAHYKYMNSDTFIGKFNISSVIPGKNNTVRVRAEITKDGVFEVSIPQIAEAGKINFEAQQLSKEEISVLIVQEVS